jgi:hypothetical protein
MLVEYIEKSLALSHVSVQLAPNFDSASAEDREKSEEYLDRYFGKLNINVYWGDCRDFVQELRSRWRAFNTKEAS